MIADERIQAAKACIQASLKLIAEGKVEDVIRHNFTSYLRNIFPDSPSWLERHIEGGEAAVKFAKAGETSTGFVDNLVDLTAIEYESDLTKSAKFEAGFGQVKDYCASLLNQGNDAELVFGVLSDTVHWRAYRIVLVEPPTVGVLGRDHIQLEEIERIDLSAGDETAAKTLIGFLTRYLGRLGSRPLNAESIAKDLGLESIFCARHMEGLRGLVDEATQARPEYAELIAELWDRFVNYVRNRAVAQGFDKNDYTNELYIVTLAKLVIANVIERRALLSDEAELRSILQGQFFKDRGLLNLVEYDYFGWLHEDAFLEKVVNVAKKIQEDLCAYDFSRISSEDLFGYMMSQLARRSQRLLLGQECTPNWLAKLIVKKVMDTLPDSETPQLVYMACGSGAMIVQAVTAERERIEAQLPNESKEEKIRLLSQTITGFDIDPLAVMLSKVTWVLAAGDLLEPFGAFPLTIPVYHADSLFAITPLSETLEPDADPDYVLKLYDHEIRLPRFLISPGFQMAFDTILDFAYEVALSSASSTLDLEMPIIDTAINKALQKSGATVSDEQRSAAKTFLHELTIEIHRLNQEKRNGVWIFMLRNSYRPGLVTGQFNGLVSNPPWLTLSKIANNPYEGVLRTKAEQFGIMPPGPSFLHVELATIFLLHAVDRYLKPGAPIGCITPDSVLNGYHHNPFRMEDYKTAARSVDFSLDEIWRVRAHTFKNAAIVLFGTKNERAKGVPNPIPGALATESGLTPLTFYRNVQGRRTAWSEEDLGDRVGGFFDPAPFRQGADIMPRTLFFHEITPAPPVGGIRQWRIRPINTGSSPLAFAIKDAKKCKSFRLTPCILPDSLIVDVVLSHLLTPFIIGAPLKAVLPIRKNARGIWEPLDSTRVAAEGSAAVSAFTQMAKALVKERDRKTVWELLNMFGKLEQQEIRAGGYIVFTGTSGGNVCAAYSESDSFDVTKLIVDQTLNWARVESEDEATYLTGLFNSEAINDVIKDFQPEGLFGKRHIHSLPFGVTPPHNPLDPIHTEVVTQTRRLQAEYEEAIAQDDGLIGMLNPNRSTLARRRSAITARLKELPSYESYSEACRVLYGV